MIVIGADTHKRTHALAAVDAGTGQVRSSQEITAAEGGELVALRWARGLDDERVWALEDCRHVSGRLERALLCAGERVVRVPPHRMGASRRGEREPGKSDQIDALAVARAVVGDGVERFPAAYVDQRAMEIRLLCDHRADLVGESTRVQNRLRWHLVALCPELETSLALRTLAGPRQLDRVDRRLRRTEGCTRVRIAREQVSQLRRLTRQVDALERELLALIKAYRPQLLAEVGCGTLTAATLIGRTAGTKRFGSDAGFARQAGIAPIKCSSGKRARHRLHRGGDRQLNRALHVIAITRARVDPVTRAYLDRKEAEGKTKKAALRCLKRHSLAASTTCSRSPPSVLGPTASPHREAVDRRDHPTTPSPPQRPRSCPA